MYKYDAYGNFIQLDCKKNIVEQFSRGSSHNYNPMPGGTWQQTCFNAKLEGTKLSATCKQKWRYDDDGNPYQNTWPTSIYRGNCPPDYYMNCDGELSCADHPDQSC